MSYEYSENVLVQESAGRVLEELGWTVVFAYNTEKLGIDGTFGRTNYREILLTRYFREALQRLNPWVSVEQVDEAQRVLTSHLSTSSLLQINEEKYALLRTGIPVTVKLPNGETEERRARVFDFQNPENNHFLAVKELKIHGDLYRRRTDIVGFVNGIPLLFVELKKNTVDVRDAYTNNYTDYLDTIPHLFYYNAFLILSNGEEAKIGTLGSPYEFFHEWKRLREEEPGSVELETMLLGVCQKKTFLDLLENFILFDHSDGKIVKILARNHQYLGVNEAVNAYAARRLTNGKLGVFWHTQGSGKSYSMAFLARKIQRKFEGTPTIVVLTDREELNNQISDTFENCGLLGQQKASTAIAASGDDLREKLKGNPSFIFTLIQKFNQFDVTPICPNHDILIMSDEAHRSQYGIFADNMMKLLPTAARIGFTGTPLLSNDQITKRTFGGYVSIYDFKRAVEDGATVPLYYENRGEKIKDLKNPEISDRILEAIEQADLDVNQQEKLENEFAKEIHLLTAEPRLRFIAKDFAKYYSDLWTSGKAMFVCLNKVTCVRMFNYVQEYWQAEIAALEARRETATQQEAQELSRKINWMRETEMAVVISQEQNEIQTFRAWGLDIATHRQKMETRKLDKEFKDSANPLRIVFVCAMWLTGFDVKSLSCLFLDKPMKAHTLMQTIARANRVSEGKSNGLILDYIGIVKALRQALADYTADASEGGGANPTIDKEKLLARIAKTTLAAERFLTEREYCLTSLVDATGFTKLGLLRAAANAVSGSVEDKKTFSTYASELKRLSRYLSREDLLGEIRRKTEALLAIYAELQKKRRTVNTTELMVAIHAIINEYVRVDETSADGRPERRFDISKIDFDLLRREFARTKEKNLLMRDLEEVIQKKLASLLLTNPNRMNYYTRYQEIIDAYNAEQNRATIEKTFMDLMTLANSLDEEQRRYVKEDFKSDEELAIYDLLFRDDLSKSDIKKVKSLAVDLLQKIKTKIAELNQWTDKQGTKAEVQNLIRDTLWADLPECYDEESVSRYRQLIFEYVYTRYRHAVA